MPSNFVTCVILIYSVARVVFPCYRMNIHTYKHMSCHLFQLVLFGKSDNKSYFELIRPGVHFADQWLRQGNKSMASGLWGAHSWELTHRLSVYRLSTISQSFDIETAVQRNNNMFIPLSRGPWTTPPRSKDCVGFWRPKAYCIELKRSDVKN